MRTFGATALASAAILALGPGIAPAQQSPAPAPNLKGIVYTEPADTVSVIEVANGQVVDTIRTGKGAHGVSVSSDGAFVFITNIVDGTVSVIDTTARSVVATFRVGRGPNGITYRKSTI